MEEEAAQRAAHQRMIAQQQLQERMRGRQMAAVSGRPIRVTRGVTKMHGDGTELHGGMMEGVEMDMGMGEVRRGGCD